MPQKIDTILILAGGDGDRFAPLNNKMILPFNGKSLIQHIVDGVKKYTKDIVVVSNQTNNKKLINILGEDSITFVIQTIDAGGMADAMKAAREHLKGTVLVLNANDLFDFTIIPRLVEKTHQEQSAYGFVAKRMDTYFPGGYVVFDNERVTGLMEKPLPQDVPSSYVRLVVDYLPSVDPFFEELSKLPSTDDQNERALTAMMKKLSVTCLKYDDDWATIKYSWQVLSMQAYAFTHLLTAAVSTTAQLHPSAIIEGPVWIGDNTKIGAFVKIVGPCFIGENVIIGDHTLIRESTINDNALVGSGCEIARSYLSSGVMLHRNYVGDSVLAEDVLMGAGAVTANYRFDKKIIATPVKGQMIMSGSTKFGVIAGKGVKIGVNAITYPGVKLSAGTRVLPGTIVTKDL